MYAAQVQHELAINIQPKVIIPGELENQVVIPGIQSVLTLHEVGIHFHAEIMVNIRILFCALVVCNRIQFFSIAWIQRGKRISFNIMRVKL